MAVKLCDRCFNRGDYKPGPNIVIVGVEEYDLCESCKSDVRDSIINPEKPDDGKEEKPKRRPGRKSKAAENDKP